MADLPDGLKCGHADAQRLTAKGDRGAGDELATSNKTDLRRARQKARSVIRDILAAIESWMGAKGVQSMLTTDAGARRANRAITELASERLRDDLVSWLTERHKITAGRAVRAAHQQMTAVLGDVEEEQLAGDPQYQARLDAETLRQVRQVDAGMLYDTELAEQLGLNEPLAEELGNDVTRQLRIGVANDEGIDRLKKRVEAVITEGDAPKRQEMGVSGMTMKSKAELIAHDSVQDAYNQAARGRYLRNGFRYCVFDATVDFKTTDLCLRMNEYAIDMVDSPYLLPPLHPYCRSGLRPVLDVSDIQVLQREDIADSYLQTIMQTKSYRPPANAAGQFRPTAITRDQGQA